MHIEVSIYFNSTTQNLNVMHTFSRMAQNRVQVIMGVQMGMHYLHLELVVILGQTIKMAISLVCKIWVFNVHLCQAH